MANAGAAFIAGLLGGGLKGYQLSKEYQYQDAKESRDKEDHDLNVAEKKRQAANETQLDSLKNAFLATYGNPPTSVPAPGQADPSVPAATQTAPGYGYDFFTNQPAATPSSDQASAGTAPATPSTSPSAGTGSSIPAPSGATPSAAGAAPSTPPTAGLGAPNSIGGIADAITNPQRQKQILSQISLLRGDVNTAAELSKQADQERYAKGDMDYVKRVLADPAGKEAQGLLGMVGTAGIPGVSLQTNPDTGVTTLQVADKNGQTNSTTMTPDNMAQLALAKRKFDRNDPAALTNLAAVNKNFAAAGLAHWKVQTELAKINNDAAHTGAGIIQQGITSGLKINADQRASEQQALEQKRFQEASDAAAALVKEHGGSQAEQDAARTGAVKLPALGAGKDNKYVYQSSAVAQTLGDVVRDPKTGQPVIDPLSGKVQTVPNPDRVARFATYMSKNDIRDTNEGLLKFQAMEAGAANAAKAPADAVQMLRGNPALATKFDAWYGDGAAAFVLNAAPSSSATPSAPSSSATPSAPLKQGQPPSRAQQLASLRKQYQDLNDKVNDLRGPIGNRLPLAEAERQRDEVWSQIQKLGGD